MEKQSEETTTNTTTNSTSKQDQKEDDETLNLPGYGYWKREQDLVDRDKFIPKPLDSTSNSQLVLENKSSVGSAWNSAGTWEEKHYKKNQVEEFFNKFLGDNKQVVDGVWIKSVKGYSGDVSEYC